MNESFKKGFIKETGKESDLDKQRKFNLAPKVGHNNMADDSELDEDDTTRAHVLTDQTVSHFDRI